jgi:hypothetical protein
MAFEDLPADEDAEDAEDDGGEGLRGGCGTEGIFSQRLALCMIFGYTAELMSTASEISAAIRCLPVGERWDLLHEFADELWAEWDAQIESDVKSGRLDDFISEARDDLLSVVTADD